MSYFFLVLIGISAGSIVAGGLFAFLVALGIINRLAVRTGTAMYIRLYEKMIILGAIIFNLIFLFCKNIYIGYVGLGFMGVFFGMYIGIQAMALAEVIKAIPIMTSRINLKEGMPYIVVAIAIGKVLGSLFELCY